MKNLAFKTPLFVILSLFSVSAFAANGNAGNMAFSIPAMGNATAVPSLSGTMLIVLSLLLFVVAFRISKQKGAKGAKAGKFFLTLLAVGALTSGISGIKLVSEVNAGGQGTLPLTITSGTTGTVVLFDRTGPQGLASNFINYFDNPNTVNVTITAINASTGFQCSAVGLVARPIDTGAPVCSVSSVIPPNSQCQIQCFSTAINFSDIRVKQDVTFLSKLKNGLKLYSFKYLPEFSTDNTRYVGVMAQDLLTDPRYKDAVITMDNGYYGVKYHQLGLKMMTLEEWKKSSPLKN